MKLTTLILVAAILQVSASTFAQKITLSEKNTPLNKVFEKISDQTGYDFIVSSESLKLAKPVNVNIQNEDLRPALDKIFANQPLAFVIQEKMVIVSKKAASSFNDINVSVNVPLTITGTVTDTNGFSLLGATIKIKGSNKSAVTDAKGLFSIMANDGDEIEITFVGFQPYSFIARSSDSFQKIVLYALPSKLNEVQVIGYGTVTKRFSTGSISTLNAATIEKQPVTNLISTLSGRLPGVFVQTTNGLPGGNINIQIRGQGSLVAGNNPLYIIDDVPFDATSVGVGLPGTSPVNGKVNPLNSINPSDIASITILKDADATSIYGSRGTNGVILITTKKGQQGSHAQISITKGSSKATNLPELLNLDQYIQIRKEAFANDHLTPTTANGFDLLSWDQSNSTNWGKYLFGNTAHYLDATASISGGNAGTTYFLSSTYHNEDNIITKEANYTRGNVYFNMKHLSIDKKFELQFSNVISIDNNKSPNIQNAGIGLFLAPNFPLLDANGIYTINAGNPLRDLNATAYVKTTNVVTNLGINYTLTDGLKLKLSGGYNRTGVDQTQLFPSSSLSSGTNFSYFNKNAVQTFIVEPQATFNKKVAIGELSMILGTTYQYKSSSFEYLKASNFSNEGLMENLGSAASIDIRTNGETPYKYVSLFGRATYNIFQKYILNVTIRRDGSTRFGSENRFGTFGSIGGAWIFSDENYIKKNLSAISFGKLRISYGSTGNDQITDYQYLSTYSSQGSTYQNVATQGPQNTANGSFHWETTKKLDLAIDLGFFENRILVTADYYLNRSSDQLVNYALPAISGISSYQANLPAVVQNTGLELELNTTNFRDKNWNWTTTFNLTLPRNKLVSFDNFANSSYTQTFELGYDITRVKGYKFLGVNPQTGVAIYADKDGAPATSTGSYYNNFTLGKRTPDLYGGFGNTITYKQISLDVFFQFAKQVTFGGIRQSLGLPLNNYSLLTNRWQNPGDVTSIPKASTIADSFYPNSSANIFDSSYIRLKNVGVNYRLPTTLSKKIGAIHIDVFVRGQNLLTFYHKNGAFLDPESGGFSSISGSNIPPVRSLVAGLNINF